MKIKYTSVSLLIGFFLFCNYDLSAKNQNRDPDSPKTAISATNSSVGMQSTPLTFIENAGQITDQFGKTRSDIQFQLKTGTGLSIFIGSGAVHYQFCEANRSMDSQAHDPLLLQSGYETQNPGTYSMYRMDVGLIGANKSAKVLTEQIQNYHENYFTSKTGEEGATAFSYDKVTYKDIYPNIDWVLYTIGGKLKHEFIVHEGGNVGDIMLRYEGATSLKIDNEGKLVARTPQGSITEQAPITFQKDGKKVYSRYVLNGTVLKFETGNYTGELIIDPALFWGTYYGGSLQELPSSTAVDGAGNVYITGYTQSVAAIATTGAHQTMFAGTEDVYLAKFNSTGAIQWATYYGDVGQDHAYGVATDASGNVYVAGRTTSSSGIATSGAHDTSIAIDDAFLVKFSSSGIRQWSTYYGGGGGEVAFSVATDASGNVFIAGKTTSSTDIATAGAYQTTFLGGTGYNCDAFLAKFSSVGTRIWATYYGGVDDDNAYDMAIDATGNVYITGYTISTTGIATSGAHQTTFGGGPNDAFLAKFNSTGVIQWSTYYGGIQNDIARSVAVDGIGNVYIAGHTASPSFIASPGAHQTVFAGGVYDCFIAKFNSSGIRQWGTYYGGSDIDYGFGIATDGSGNVFLGGETRSISGISTPGTHQPTRGVTYSDGFLAKLNGSGVRQWGSYFGGGSYDYASDVCVDASGGVFITGHTESTWGIATSGAYQTTYGGSFDAFLAKFDGSFIPTLTGPITGTATLCIGGTTTLTNATAGGTWRSGTTSVAAVGVFTGVVTGIAAGTSTISYIAPSGTVTLVVTVSATPAPITAPSFDVCVGSNITLSSATAGGWWSSSSSGTAAIGSSTGIVTGVSTATATISYTYLGCYTTNTVTVLAIPSPAISGTYTVCPGHSLALAGATPGGTWSSSNPSVGTVDASLGVVDGISTGTTMIKYIVSNICGSDSATQVITVVPASSCTTGIINPNTEAAILSIYPNPSQGSVTIKMESPIDEQLNFVVTNIVGEKIKEFTGYANQTIKINIKQPPGIYYIKTVSGTNSYVAKLMIQ